MYLHEFFEPILFFDPMGKFGCFGKQKTNKISKTRVVMPIKFGLHEFFEPILFFDPIIVHGLKGNFGQNLKSSNIFESGNATPAKFGFRAFTSTSTCTCLNFFNRFLF